MKLAPCLALSTALVCLPCQRAKAPVPVALGLALKCIAIGTITSTAVIIFKCEPDYFLVRYQDDEYSEPHWACSQATAATLKKTGGRRCEGPWKKRDEPDFRAWVNNKNPWEPMFPCGPLGTIPNATRTNWMKVTLQQSTDGGGSWTSMASTTTAYGSDGSDDGWSFCKLSPSGTAGMTREQRDEVLGASEVFTNTATVAIFRTQHEATNHGGNP